MGAESKKNRSSHRAQHHWASKCKVDFSKEFQDKGIPLETTQSELNKRELNDLERFFNMEESEDPAQGSTGEPESLSAEAVHALKGIQGAPEETKGAEAEDVMNDAAWLYKKWSSAARHGKLSVETRPPMDTQEASTSRMESTSVQRTTFSIVVDQGADSRQSALSFATFNLADVIQIDRRSIIANGFGGKAFQRVHQPITFRELKEARAPVPMFLSDFDPITPRAEPRPQETHYDYFARRIPGEAPENRQAKQLKMETTRRVFSPRRAEQARLRNAGTATASQSSPASPDQHIPVLPAAEERPSTTPAPGRRGGRTSAGKAPVVAEAALPKRVSSAASTKAGGASPPRAQSGGAAGAAAPLPSVQK